MDPQGSELERYAPDQEYGKSGFHYAHVAVLPNLSGSGRVMLIEGTTGEATEAAGEFVTVPGSLANLPGILGVDDLDRLARFELVLKTWTVGGSASEAEVIAVRAIDNREEGSNSAAEAEN